MPLRARLSGMFPNMGEIQAQLDAKFDKLYAVLVEIRDKIQVLIDKGGP